VDLEIEAADECNSNDYDEVKALIDFHFVGVDFCCNVASSLAEEQPTKKPAPKAQAVQPKGPAAAGHPPMGTGHPMVGPGPHAVVGSGHPIGGPGVEIALQRVRDFGDNVA
jgi:hypothetical protein